MAASTNLTPAERTERARLAGRASAQVRREDITAHVRAVVDRAPELSPEQADRLRALLAPAASRVRAQRAGSRA